MGKYKHSLFQSLLPLKRLCVTALIMSVIGFFKLKVKAIETTLDTSSTYNPSTTTFTNGTMNLKASLEVMIDHENGFIQVDKDRRLDFSGTIQTSSAPNYYYTISIWVYINDLLPYFINLW